MSLWGLAMQAKPNGNRVSRASLIRRDRCEDWGCSPATSQVLSLGARGTVTGKLTVTDAAPLEANWSDSRDDMIYITKGRLCHSQFSLVAPTCINLIMAR